jgi:hypothetical protein
LPPSCRRYVHLYQQKLDALQPKASPADTSSSNTDSTATGQPNGAAATTPETPEGSPAAEPDAALQLELQRLEHHLGVDDILLCRSLAELALERVSSSTGEQGGSLLKIVQFSCLTGGQAALTSLSVCVAAARPRM